jgi:peptide/nickel transport system substrate-binding protein
VTRSWRSRALVVPMVALAMIGAAACGKGGGDNGSAGSGPAKADQNMINPQPRDKVQDGGKLVWPIDEFPANFNYNELDGTVKAHADVFQSYMPTMFDFDASGKPMWNKDYLAEEPKVDTGAQQVVTYKINPKAVWSDGTPITWNDFAAQWKALNGTNPAFQVASTTGYDQIASVEKGADDREVKVTFKQKFSDWQSLYVPLFPASANKDPKTFNEGWKDKPLVTAGPFKLGSIDKTAKTITVVRDDKWWGDKAKLDQIVYRVIDPNAQTDAYVNGEIDFIDIASDVNKYNRVKGVATGEIRKAGGPNFRHITINGTSPVLQDVKVRQALAMAINRDAIAKALLGPLGIDPKPLNNHIFMANQDGYKDNSGDVGKYNLDKAKQMLDEAGWKVSGSTRQKDGKPLSINFVIPSGVATSKQEAELIQNMLAQANVTVKINSVPLDDFFDKYITPGQFDMTVFSWIGTQFPISSNRAIYANPKKNAKGELDIQQNYARTGSPEIDDLFAKATSELDRAKAIDLANQIDAKIFEEVHSLPTYQRPDLVAAKKNLANYGAIGFATVKYQDVGWVKS